MPILQGIFDEVIDNALLVFRLAAQQRGMTVERLRKLEKVLIGKLAEEQVTKRQRRRVETFFDLVDKVIDRHYRQLQLEFDFFGISTTVAEDIQAGLRIVLGYDAINLPTTDYFKSLSSDVMIMGAPSQDWWRGQSEDLKFRFAAQVRQGLANAETNQQIINRIVGKSGQPGIMETARRNAAALVQTSVQTVANDARRATFKANSDVIKGIRQVSTLDGHTSLVCIAYSECEWDLDFKPIGPKAKRKPYNGGTPRHFNCRSVEVPITKTFAELGLKNVPEPKGTTRASADGPIDVNTSFKDFLDRRGRAYQDKMLGKGRADLWRAGKITLRDLVDGNGRPLTLAELQELVRQKRR
jgi:hypothetical protein